MLGPQTELIDIFCPQPGSPKIQPTPLPMKQTLLPKCLLFPTPVLRLQGAQLQLTCRKLPGLPL